MNKHEDGAFYSSKTKGSVLTTPALRICHRILAYNLFGKRDSSSSLSQQEVYILWCITKGRKLNFGGFATAHLHIVLSKSMQRLSLSHMVTVCAQRMVCKNTEHKENALPEEALDLACLSKIIKIKEISLDNF